MGKRKAIYYNFPLMMLNGMTNKTSKDKGRFETLNNILDYCIYDTYLKYDYLNENEKENVIEKDLGINFGSFKNCITNGKKQYNKFFNSKVKVGLNSNIFWDYYKNDKTDFQIICLLGFLAIKSVLGSKPFCKMNNAIFLSRMNGEEKTMQGFSKLPTGIKFFNTEYRLKKIKTELQDNWGLKHYARYTRGFYVSFTLSKEKLILEAEKRRRSNKENNRKDKEKEYLQKALQKLKEVQE